MKLRHDSWDIQFLDLLIDYYWYTLGKHDFAIVEAPNDEAMASVLLSTGSLGNVHTETLKAFSMTEAAGVIEKLS